MLKEKLQENLHSIFKQAIIQANMLETIVVLMVVSENIFNLSEIKDERLFSIMGTVLIFMKQSQVVNIEKTMD